MPKKTIHESFLVSLGHSIMRSNNGVIGFRDLYIRMFLVSKECREVLTKGKVG